MVQKLNPAALNPILKATSSSVIPRIKKNDLHLDLFPVLALRLIQSPSNKHTQADTIPATANAKMVRACGTLVANDSVANEMANRVLVRHILYIYFFDFINTSIFLTTPSM
jgi:hypothetical protein